MLVKFINLLIEPKVLTPIVCVLLVLPVQNPMSLFVIHIAIISALVGGFYEIQDDDIDTFEFSLVEMREKRYLILSIGIIFFWIASISNASVILTIWSQHTFHLISLFLAVTVMLKQRLSAHTLFLFINSAGIYLYTSSVFAHLALIILLLIVGYSRVRKGKHTYIQIFSSSLLCLPYYLILVIK